MSLITDQRWTREDARRHDVVPIPDRLLERWREDAERVERKRRKRAKRRKP